ncbi:MAG: hypothetical protein ACREQY_15140, partial [Candidatus Binatia bacterium]
MRQKTAFILGTVLSLAAAGAARADGYQLNKSFDLGSGGTFRLSTEAGGAEVRGGDGEKATVVITAKRSDFEEKYDVIIEEAKGSLEVTIERKGRRLFSWDWNEGAHVAVTLPRHTSATIKSSGGGVEIEGLEGNVEARSSGGGVEVLDVVGDVVAASSGGGVDIERIKGGAKIDSSGGSVSARNVAGDIDAGSSGGGVRIAEAGGMVVASSSGGGVSVGFAAGNAKGGDIHSSGGGVTAKVDPTLGLEIDAYASGGDAD